MRIAHRKNVLFRDRAWWDTAVNACSGFGGFAHSELIFDNGLSFTSTTEYEPSTLMYPTHAEMVRLGRKNGPMIRRIEFPDSLWEFTELPLNDSQKLQCHQWCMEIIDRSIKDRAGYDWAGVMRFVFKFMHEHPKDWFCSEVVLAAIQPFDFWPQYKPWTVSPNKLRALCRVLEELTPRHA